MILPKHILKASIIHKVLAKILLTTISKQYWYDNCLFIAIMYSFLGISLATQDYINPSIDIIKKKGVVSIS